MLSKIFFGLGWLVLIMSAGAVINMLYLVFYALSIGSTQQIKKMRLMRAEVLKWVLRGLLLTALLLTLGLLSGCATPQGYGPDQFFRNVSGRVVSGLPQVDFPVLRQLGVTPGGQNVVVLNGTPFYCRVVVYGTEVGQLAPGDQLVGSKYFEPLSPQIPVAVIFFRDSEFKQYVGASGRTFQFMSGYPGGISWSIQAREIQTPEGAYSPAVLGGNYPLPETIQSGKRVELPREAWNATAGVQVVNNTLYTVTTGFDGAYRVSIPPGAVRYTSIRALMGPGQIMSGQMVFTDNGRLAGTYDYQFGVPPNGVIAYQLVVSPWMIRR